MGHKCLRKFLYRHISRVCSFYFSNVLPLIRGAFGLLRWPLVVLMLCKRGLNFNSTTRASFFLLSSWWSMFVETFKNLGNRPSFLYRKRTNVGDLSICQGWWIETRYWRTNWFSFYDGKMKEWCPKSLTDSNNIDHCEGNGKYMKTWSSSSSLSFGTTLASLVVVLKSLKMPQIGGETFLLNGFSTKLRNFWTSPLHFF